MNDSVKKLKILAVGAHPDDIEFGAGGVLLNECDAGSEIFMAITSKGESGTSGTPEIRVAESTAAAEMLGAGDRLTFLDFGGDGRQVATPGNTTLLARLIREIRPDVVLAPSLHENQHPDHTAVGTACRNACRISRYGGFAELLELPAHAVGSLWFYSVTPAPDQKLEGALLIDVSATFERWVGLMKCHETQVSSRSYVEFQTSRARQLGLMAGCGHAIAVWPNDPPVLRGIGPVSQTARRF